MSRKDLNHVSMDKWLILVILLLQYSTCESRSQKQRQAHMVDDDASRIDLLASSILNCSTWVGTNIAVVQDGETVFSRGYGQMDLESGREVTSDTLYNIGSITKSMTSVLLGKLLKDHGYSWNTKVHEILEEQEFQFTDPYLTCNATLKDLAAHRTGVSNRNFAVLQDVTRKQLVENVRFSSVQNPFRDGFTYNNNIYGVIAYIIEKLSGKTFEETMTEELFQPLGMDSATFLHQVDLSDENFAHPFLADPLDGNNVKPVPLAMDVDRVGAGAGSVVSTAEDMAQYMKLHLGNGEVDGVRVFDADVIEETQGRYQSLYVSQTSRPRFPVTYEMTSYGFGPISGSYRGYRVIHLEGALIGYASMGVLLPDLNIGVYSHGVALSTLEGRQKRSLLLMYIVDLLLGTEPWLDENSVCTFPEPWSNAENGDFINNVADIGQVFGKNFDKLFYLDLMNVAQLKHYMDDVDIKAKDKAINNGRSTDVASYVGTYGNFQFGNVTVKESGDTLQLSYGKGTWSLQSFIGNNFLGTPDESSFPLYLIPVVFSEQNSETGLYEELQVSFMETDRNIFQRDLDLSDAPPFPSVNCN